MLDVRRLRVLREVARHGSFSAAAEALSFTQSAISQQIAVLEREAGTRLVERSPRGVWLTPAGEALVTHADAILARLEDAAQELAAIAGLDGGRLRFGTFPSAGATLVPRAVAAFTARFPNVELRMVEAEPEDSLPQLRAGELDLFLGYDYDAVPDPTETGIERIALTEDRVDAVLPPDHPLAARRTVKLTDLADDPWVWETPRGACHRMFLHATGQAGFEPRIAFQTDDYQATQAFVAAGVGVTMLPRLCLTPAHPGVVVRSLGRAAPVRRVWAAVLREGYRSPAAEAMIAALAEVAGSFWSEASRAA